MMDRWRSIRDNFSASIKLSQNMLFIGGAVVLCVSVVVVVLLTKVSVTTDSPKTKPKEIQINSANRSISAQEIWVDRLERDREFLNKRLEALEQVVEAVALTKQASEPDDRRPPYAKASGDRHMANDSAYESESEVQHMQTPATPRPGPKTPYSEKSILESTVVKPVIRRVTFQLKPDMKHKLGQTVDHYVPAGSFAQAVLTSGVVAKTSIDAASNPQPIHMEITDFGNLPRKFKSDIKSCFVTGAAYGDLAAERAFVRLEKFSCVERNTGEVIEANVEGYVVGEDGANGLRGNIVDRSGPAVRNAFVGGFISGMGGFFAQSHNQPLIVIPGGGVAAQSLQPKQILETGTGRGLSSAMEKYADFYIKRAEQAQPVIEIEAGRRVDIVFQKGFDLNQTLYRKSLVNKRERDVKDTTQPATIGTHSNE